MARYISASLAVHCILVALLIYGGRGDTRYDDSLRTVRIRLIRPSAETRRIGSAPGSPRDAPRRETPDRGRVPEPNVRSIDWSLQRAGDRPGGIQRNIPRRADPVSPRLPFVPPPPLTDIIPAERLDPLSGMESALPAHSPHPGPDSNPWVITWADGARRGIIKSPSISSDALPAAGERPADVKVVIVVSAQGEVVSAEIDPPGSGDIRIDRYIVGKAFDFAFEESIDGSEHQRAVFQLVFRGGPG